MLSFLAKGVHQSRWSKQKTYLEFQFNLKDHLQQQIDPIRFPIHNSACLQKYKRPLSLQNYATLRTIVVANVNVNQNAAMWDAPFII